MTDTQRIRQIERQLAEYDSSSNAAERFKKIDLLNELAWTLLYSENQQVNELQARELSETAYALAGSPEDGDPPYEAGLAYSL